MSRTEWGDWNWDGDGDEDKAWLGSFVRGGISSVELLRNGLMSQYENELRVLGQSEAENADGEHCRRRLTVGGRRQTVDGRRLHCRKELRYGMVRYGTTRPSMVRYKAQATERCKSRQGRLVYTLSD